MPLEQSNLLNLSRVVLVQILAIALWPLHVHIFKVCKAFRFPLEGGKIVMAEKDQVENLHKKGRFCICAESMAEFLDEIGFSPKFNSLRAIAKRLDFPALTNNYPFVTDVNDELFTFLAHFCSRSGWTNRMRKAVSFLKVQWKKTQVDYTLLGALFDAATSRWKSNVEVIDWFVNNVDYDGSLYITSKHILNAIVHFSENELSYKDSLRVQWMVQMLQEMLLKKNLEGDLEVSHVMTPEMELAFAKIQKKVILTEVMGFKEFLLELSLSVSAYLTEELKEHLKVYLSESIMKFGQGNELLNKIIRMTIPLM